MLSKIELNHLLYDDTSMGKKLKRKNIVGTEYLIEHYKTREELLRFILGDDAEIKELE